jgi:hypothetical protein
MDPDWLLEEPDRNHGKLSKDGSVVIPEALRPYLGDLSVIRPEALI